MNRYIPRWLCFVMAVFSAWASMNEIFMEHYGYGLFQAIMAMFWCWDMFRPEGADESP